MTTKRGYEHKARWQMRFLANWLEFWIESKELGEDVEIDASFGIKQIDNLQRTLSALRLKLQGLDKVD